LLFTSYGALLLPSEDIMLLRFASESGGILEPGTIKVLESLIQEGDCVLDIGANIGLTVIPAARQVGLTGEVIAFEPSSRAASLLSQSLALNALSGRVTLHQNAVGDAKGFAQLNVGRNLGHSSLLSLDDSTGQEEVSVETVDSLVPPGKRVRLAKIDAEGYELRVWQGMQRVIAENPEMVAIVEFGPSHLARAGLTVDTWIAAFQAVGFAAYEIDEITGCLRPQRPNADLASVYSLNMLMSRQPPSAFPKLRFQ
jgi:FkbM family methyltransferase